jgi:uncharacterized 2Fe-2S/4Fe-4S cluster protein (DUF4445 family)
MPKVTAIYGEEQRSVEVQPGSLLGDAIAKTGLPLEQPCAGRGTCGKCKVLVEEGVRPPDDIEFKNLTTGELALNNRLACRARVDENARIVLSPIVVYSNKIFKSSSRYKREPNVPLGIAIDLGSTTVAAFLTMLDNGEVTAGGAGLNQQTVFGADVISRLAAAIDNPKNAARLQRLALASINQAVDSLRLSERIRQRIERVTIVGNVAMHHLLAKMPIESLAVMPFQPYSRESIQDATYLMGGIFPDGAKVSLPPMIGGFVGSDALACLAYFEFDNAPGPMAAIDLGTNGEVMVTDGKRILTASTAAGPAFEGVNISCGTRAIDGAVVDVTLNGEELILSTLADEAPIGLTGSGLLSAVHQLRQAGVIDFTGRIQANPARFADLVSDDANNHRGIKLTPDGSLRLTQTDVRELQKAKGAIRAAIGVLMEQLDLASEDLQKVILTGSFGGQVDINAILEIGMIPLVDRDIVKTVANGAGFGGAMFLSDEGFAMGQKLADHAEQVDLDTDANFNNLFIEGMYLVPDGYRDF